MDEINQLVSAILTLVLAAVTLIAGQLYIGAKSRFQSPRAPLSPAVLARSYEKPVR
jgi:hypothetical protein